MCYGQVQAAYLLSLAGLQAPGGQLALFGLLRLLLLKKSENVSWAQKVEVSETRGGHWRYMLEGRQAAGGKVRTTPTSKQRPFCSELGVTGLSEQGLSGGATICCSL